MRIKGISLIRGTTRKRKVDVRTKQSDKFHSLKFYSWYPLIPVLTVFLLRQTIRYILSADVVVVAVEENPARQKLRNICIF